MSMVSTVLRGSTALRGLAGIPVTIACSVALFVASTVLLNLDPTAQDRVVRHASTNLHNLSHGHVGTLLGSAFVVDAGPVYVWLPGLVCLLALGELLWRSARLILAFVVGHIGATVLVAAGLTAAVTNEWLPRSVTRADDVGMSYGAAGVLGALTPAIPAGWRLAWVGWWLGVGVSAIAVDRDFTDVGHAVALLLGVAVATRFGTPRAWTAVRIALACPAVVFGFLLVADTEDALVVAVSLGAAGALLGMLLARPRRLGRSPTGTARPTPRSSPSATIRVDPPEARPA